jgi:DNA-damage-inducible protein D
MNEHLPDFESIKQMNMIGDEYWSARSLAPLLGYSASWQNFERVIKDAMIAAAEGGLNLDENFNAVVKVSGTRGPKQKDYFLSKRACYLVAQNGDPRKPEIAAAMNYFAFAGEVLDDLNKLRLEQEKRLQLRLKVAQANSNLAETALGSGVQSQNMPVFQDAGYMGQYHMTENQLAAFWNVPPGTKILDVMGVEHLAANLFRITQTDAKLANDNIRDEDVAIATHHEIGSLVRETIERIHHIKPENLPRGASIRKLVEEARRKEKKRRKNKPEEGQGTLF